MKQDTCATLTQARSPGNPPACAWHGTRLQCSHPAWIQPMRGIAVADSSLSIDKLSSQCRAM